jgi:hypothetical protein
MSNEEYQIYTIRQELLDDILKSEKTFFSRFDTRFGKDCDPESVENAQNQLEKYLSEFIIEAFCFAEDFKEAWFNFFSKSFLDHVDRGEFDINVFN